MTLNIEEEILALDSMKGKELREKFREVFQMETNSNNAAWLRKRIGWRMQANSEGSLSERAKCRAAELANEADLRQRPPANNSATVIIRGNQKSTGRDARLPQAGTLLSRSFKGKDIIVKVLEDGFLYEDREYSSLSAIATEIAGKRWNGFLFFGLQKKDKV